MQVSRDARTVFCFGKWSSCCGIEDWQRWSGPNPVLSKLQKVDIIARWQILALRPPERLVWFFWDNFLNFNLTKDRMAPKHASLLMAGVSLLIGPLKPLYAQQKFGTHIIDDHQQGTGCALTWLQHTKWHEEYRGDRTRCRAKHSAKSDHHTFHPVQPSRKLRAAG